MITDKNPFPEYKNSERKYNLMMKAWACCWFDTLRNTPFLVHFGILFHLKNSKLNLVIFFYYNFLVSYLGNQKLSIWWWFKIMVHCIFYQKVLLNSFAWSNHFLWVFLISLPECFNRILKWFLLGLGILFFSQLRLNSTQTFFSSLLIDLNILYFRDSFYPI